RQAWVLIEGSSPQSSTGSWCSSPASLAPSSSRFRGFVVAGLPSARKRRSRKEAHMCDRPYTLVSCALSIDGYLASATPRRLALSNDADFDRVDAVRASCDAILVGAATVRNDNPRLLVRSKARQEARRARGLCPSPMKVTVTERAHLDARADFFLAREAEALVYRATPAAGR